MKQNERKYPLIHREEYNRGGWMRVPNEIEYYDAMTSGEKRSAVIDFIKTHPQYEFAVRTSGVLCYRPAEALGRVFVPETPPEEQTITGHGLVWALDQAADKIERLEARIVELEAQLIKTEADKLAERERADQFERQLSLGFSQLSERARKLLLPSGR